MQVLNVGSINIDHVYEVDHFVRPGETLAGSSYRVFAGGKGFNQSVALARAGVRTLHVGKVGANSQWLLERLEQDGVDTRFVTRTDTPTGHAIIQVAPSGENAIVLFGGANRCVTDADVESALEACSQGDYLLTQNETSCVADAIRLAHERKLKIAFNPAPMGPDVRAYPLDLVDIFILNETEAEALTGTRNTDEAIAAMRGLYPGSTSVLTLGSEGAICSGPHCRYHESALQVDAVDTTAAGDTFIGYFLAELTHSNDAGRALKQGCRAAAWCVTKPGAADSIPLRGQLHEL